ncbi:MAG: hypothetical protein V4613_14250 [Bacteroidota bacterium]
MRHIFFIFSLLFFCQAQGQNTVAKGNIVPVVGYWQVGKTKNVIYTNTKTTVRNGKTTSDISTYKATWKIADSTAKNYIIHYTYKEFSFSNLNDSLSNAYAEMFKGVTVKYRTTETGVFDTILNMNEIIDLSKKGVDKIILKLNWADNAASRHVIDKLKTLLNSPQLLSNTISEEMVIIHYFHGLEYKQNTPYTYDSNLDNNFGGEPFPAKAVLKLSAINAPADKIKLIATITPVISEYKRILYETMVALAAQLGLPKPKKSDFETSFLQQKCEAELSLRDGWPIKVSFIKISSVQEDKNTDTTTITFTD